MTLALALCSGCATPRLERFAEFERAGDAYVAAAEAVLEEAAVAAVDADSAVLAQARTQLRAAQDGLAGEALREQRSRDRDELTARLNEHNVLLRGHLMLLGEIADHARGLGDYFSLLRALAGDDRPAPVARAAADAARSLGRSSERIRNARIGEARVVELVRPIAEFTVAQFQRAALDAELTGRADTIANEIELGRAALEAVGLGLEADTKLVARATERNRVLDPFRNTARALPASWPRNRRQLLVQDPALGALRAAESASQKLEASFVALARNELEREDLSGLLADAERALALVARIRARP